MVDRSRRARPCLAGGLLLLSALLTGCSEDPSLAAPSGAGPSAAPPTSGAPVSPSDDHRAAEGGCADVHAGHQAMMWTAQMADEMLDAGCGWPYDPFLVGLDGGEDDPTLDTPFEPRRYSELWSAISSSGLGLCSVATTLTGQDAGRAFGFDYRLGEPACPGAVPTGSLEVGEYGTEAQRDAAAHSTARDADAERVYVLGRWVIALHGDGARVARALESLGAEGPS